MTPELASTATTPRAADNSMATVDEHDEHGRHRAVDEQQHDPDDQEGDGGDLVWCPALPTSKLSVTNGDAPVT